MTDIEIHDDPKTPEPDADPETTVPIEPKPRKRVRWYHVVTLGLAVLVCAAAIGFSVSQSSDRDDATSTHEAARAALVEQRAGAKHAREQLTRERDETKVTLGMVEQVTSKLHELTDLANAEMDAVNAAHQIAVTNADDVDGYNAQVDRGNALLPVMQAKSDEIIRMVEDFRRSAEAQTAAIVR